MKFLVEKAAENKTKFIEDLARVLKDKLEVYTKAVASSSDYYMMLDNCSDWDYASYNKAYQEYKAKAQRAKGEIISIIGDTSFVSLVRAYKRLYRANKINSQPTDPEALAFSQVEPQGIGKIKPVGTMFYKTSKPDTLFEIVAIKGGNVEYRAVGKEEIRKVSAGVFQNTIKNKQIQYKE